jgi:hypothetical protein
LCTDLGYQSRLVRFIENHDEPRAAGTFTGARQRAAAVVVATIPGAKLFHQGQFEGWKVRLPVFLARRPPEESDPALQSFYRTLVVTASAAGPCSGDWQLCDRHGWPDNASYQHIVAWCWRSATDACLVAVNLSDADAQALVRLPWNDLAAKTYQITDVMSGQVFQSRGDDVERDGVYMGLGARGFQVLRGWRQAA